MCRHFPRDNSVMDEEKAIHEGTESSMYQRKSHHLPIPATEGEFGANNQPINQSLIRKLKISQCIISVFEFLLRKNVI